jgi:hypothetical protein
VCGCCGYEFGNDDEPGTADAVSFSDHLAEWVVSGAGWFEPAKRPAGWNLEQQLRTAGLK